MNTFKQDHIQFLSLRYVVMNKIQSGAYGVVYKVVDNQTSQMIALKVDTMKSHVSSLRNEIQILSALKGLKGVPQLLDFGTTLDRRFYLTQELHDSDLQQIKSSQGKFSLKTVLMIGSVILTTLEQIHRRNIIHRDIKPENIMTSHAGGIVQLQSLILIDYGISKFMDRQISCSEFVGSPRYASRNSHKGIQCGYRDDIESLMFVLIHLHKGVLPWDNTTKWDTIQGEIEWIGNCKNHCYNTAILTNNMPKQFNEILAYIDTLPYNSKPDYSYLQNLFDCMMKDNNFTMDYEFDWNNQEANYSLQINSPSISPIKSNKIKDTNSQFTIKCIHNNLSSIQEKQTVEINSDDENISADLIVQDGIIGQLRNLPELRIKLLSP